MDFATRGEKEYDWFNSWHFADKGLMLAYGKDMGPEDLNDWDIPIDVRPDMDSARAFLISALTPDHIRNSPAHAAEAQFYFDCWVKYQEANWQTNEINYCRDHLFAALEDLHAGAASPAPKAKAASKPKPVAKAVDAAPSVAEKTADFAADAKAPAEEKKPTAADAKKPAAEAKRAETISYAVFFEADKAQLSEPGKNVISEVIDSLKHVPSYEIVLHGTANKNLGRGLSNERSQVVKKRLIEGGISERAIKMSSDAASSDAVKAPSRRIEIFLNE